jgi:outer membrane protein TolC
MSTALLLTACSAMRTPYIRPSIPEPAQYEHTDAAATASLDHWWRGFGDNVGVYLLAAAVLYPVMGISARETHA